MAERWIDHIIICCEHSRDKLFYFFLTAMFAEQFLSCAIERVVWGHAFVNGFDYAILGAMLVLYAWTISRLKILTAFSGVSKISIENITFSNGSITFEAKHEKFSHSMRCQISYDEFSILLDRIKAASGLK